MRDLNALWRDQPIVTAKNQCYRCKICKRAILAGQQYHLRGRTKVHTGCASDIKCNPMNWGMKPVCIATSNRGRCIVCGNNIVCGDRYRGRMDCLRAHLHCSETGSQSET